jgi:hypothetical protein
VISKKHITNNLQALSIIVIMPVIGLLIFLLGSVVLTIFLPHLAYKIGVPLPFEDAAMMFRYAENFSRGFGIVWNAKESPSLSDGNTDLGFVLILFPLIKLGLSVVNAALILNLTALIGIGIIFRALNLRYWNLPTWFLLTALSVLAVSESSSIAGGFSAAIFGFILLSVFYFTYSIFEHNNYTETSLIKNLLLGILIGSSGWWRPEGFILGPAVFLITLFLLEKSLLKNRFKDFVYKISIVVTSYLITLALWVMLRLLYFKNLFPTAGLNKFEIKSLVSLETFFNTCNSFMFFVSSLFPFWFLIFVFAIIDSKRKKIIQIILMLVFVSILFSPFSLTLNWWGRHWLPMSPVVLAWALTLLNLKLNKSNIATFFRVLSLNIMIKKRILTVFLISTYVCILFSVPFYSSIKNHGGIYFSMPFTTRMFDAINEYDSSKIRIATTEAGLIPLAMMKSRVLDTYVHNTRSIAENGPVALLPELNSLKPNLLVVHGPVPVKFFENKDCTSPYIRDWPKDWTAQTKILYDYAFSNNLKLIRSEETGVCDTWNIFVSNDLPLSLVTKIAAIPSWSKRLAP